MSLWLMVLFLLFCLYSDKACTAAKIKGDTKLILITLLKMHFLGTSSCSLSCCKKIINSSVLNMPI